MEQVIIKLKRVFLKDFGMRSVSELDARADLSGFFVCATTLVNDNTRGMHSSTGVVGVQTI